MAQETIGNAQETRWVDLWDGRIWIGRRGMIKTGSRVNEFVGKNVILEEFANKRQKARVLGWNGLDKSLVSVEMESVLAPVVPFGQSLK